MADSKLRLAIVTELDNAGIKATKEQIDGLEKKLQSLGNNGASSTNKLENALGNLPGSIGKVGKALGGAVGAATALAGAWTVGWEIGTKINEFLTNELGWFDFGAEARKANEEYAKSLKEADEAAQKLFETETKRIEQLDKNTDKTIKNIERQTKAYVTQYQTVSRLQTASNDADKLALEIQKYDEMRVLRLQGKDEAAEQLGKYYDLAEAEREAKRQLQAFDDETAKLRAKRNAAADKVGALEDQKNEHWNAQVEAEYKQRKYQRNNKGLNVEDDGVKIHENYVNWKKQGDIAKKMIELQAKDDEKIEAAEQALAERDSELADRAQLRSNLAARAYQGAYSAMNEYNDYAYQTGNQLNASLDSEWASEIIKNANDQYYAMLDEKKNTDDILAILRENLVFK